MGRALEPGSVDLWLVDLSQRSGASKEKQYEARWETVREILASYLPLESDELRFTRNRFGKPELVNTELSFNLSHSQEKLLLAVTYAGNVGVDIEAFEQNVEIKKIVTNYFSSTEKAFISKKGRKDAYRLWVRKEALHKALGTGLSTPLHETDVTQESCVVGKQRYWIYDLGAKDGYLAALASSEPINSIHRQIEGSLGRET